MNLAPVRASERAHPKLARNCVFHKMLSDAHINLFAVHMNHAAASHHHSRTSSIFSSCYLAYAMLSTAEMKCETKLHTNFLLGFLRIAHLRDSKLKK